MHSKQTAVFKVLRALDTGDLAVLTLLDLWKHSTRLIMQRCCGGCHRVYAVTCCAGFSHTSTTARSMSAAVQPLPPSPFFCVEFHRGRFLDPSCSCCIRRTCCGWSTDTNSDHICTPTTRRYTAPAMHQQYRSARSGYEVALWMQSNRLHLNSSKTEVLWCVSSRHQHQIPRTPVRVGADFIQPASSVHHLGIYEDARNLIRA